MLREPALQQKGLSLKNWSLKTIWCVKSIPLLLEGSQIRRNKKADDDSKRGYGLEGKNIAIATSGRL
ncbi:hypothetical protein [Pectobacterium sp. B2J-2]|uniref:hypothetical protein n=1 Tax=Pectobacterium sp. B2J-2 TaxID=3385372 RepID=UPI0038FBF124